MIGQYLDREELLLVQPGPVEGEEAARQRPEPRVLAANDTAVSTAGLGDEQLLTAPVEGVVGW